MKTVPSATHDPAERVVGPGFHERVYEVVRRVPRGRLTTYGDVATVLGSPRVARQVGWALAALGADRPDVPWHRVINAKGRISHRGDTWRAEDQRLRLAAEGVVEDEAGTMRLKELRCPADLLLGPSSE
jgi:methylated-DNA-protein-cysteine methyltransferase-like protein